MLSKLMQVNTVQEEIIEQQAGIINDLFALVCEHVNLDNLKGIEPLLFSMKEVENRKEGLL